MQEVSAKVELHRFQFPIILFPTLEDKQIVFPVTSSSFSLERKLALDRNLTITKYISYITIIFSSKLSKK